VEGNSKDSPSQKTLKGEIKMEFREIFDFNQKCIQEAKEDKKTVKFSSPFMVADGVNKNKRQYPFH